MNLSSLYKKYEKKYLSSWLIYAIDAVVSVVSSAITLCLLWRILAFDFMAFDVVCKVMAVSAIASLISFIALRTHQQVIRYSSFRGLWRLALAVLLKEVIVGATILVMKESNPAYDGQGNSLLFAVIFDMMVTAVMLICTRMVLILIYDIVRGAVLMKKPRRVLIYGVDDKSVALLTRLRNSQSDKVVGFIHFGKEFSSHSISELPILQFSDESSFAKIVSSYCIDAIVFPNTELAKVEQDRLISYAVKGSIKVLVTPHIDEVVDGIVTNHIREIKIEDLLGREEIKISMEEIIESYKGKTILVTGAAGSIGSELCRQLARVGVSRLVLFDNAETPMHNIRLELEERFPDLRFIPIIGDVRNTRRVDMIFRVYRPDVVFHAAAYKHVPLMEENPCEAVATNVAGSRIIADKCVEYDVEKMVMISTDKAVNPTNVMGCTKRLAEIYVQSLGLAIEKGKIKAKTKFITTRFGNVLGSNGSVIPRFREQITNGGPITVTHPEIVRYFMTIPEACRLVMEAANLATGTQIFVFDMGESVKIVDLARKMIELSGLKEDVDIRIEFTGLRPGEKLYEEVLSKAEDTPTTHDRIRIACVRDYDYDYAKDVMDDILKYSQEQDVDNLVRLMKDTVPEFKSNNSVFERLDNNKITTI